MGRVLLGRESDSSLWEYDATNVDVPKHARGWRQFITTPAPFCPVKITVGDREMVIRCDRGGYFDKMVTNHNLVPGWHRVSVTTGKGFSTKGRVQIIPPDTRFGLLSDIDDTVIMTHLPRPMIAAYNAFVLTEEARDVIPGMALWYQKMLKENPGAPMVYLSTGAFNTVPFLQRFLQHHGYPQGQMLMTDWGPTNTGWFRSGREHKQNSLKRLVEDFPNISWVLVGDNGQHDQTLYKEFVKQYPDNVRLVAIRQLTPVQQALIHIAPVSLDEDMRGYLSHIRTENNIKVPVISGVNGFELSWAYDRVIGSKKP